MASLQPLDSDTAFPNESDSPEKKAKKEWLHQYAMAAMANAQGMAEGALGYSSRNLYKEWWEYVHNRQPLAYYATLTGIDIKSPIFHERSRLPISNSAYKIFVGLIEKSAGKIRVGTVDPQATLQLKKTQAERKAKLMLRQVANAQDMPDVAAHPHVMAMGNEPEDLEGLDIMAMGERLPICADAQDAIRAIFNNNKFNHIRREMIGWWYVAGAAIAKDDTEPCAITVRCCELGDIVMSYCRYPDFRDLKHIGEVVTMPISALCEMSNGQIKKSDLEALYKQGNATEWYTDASVLNEKGWWGSAKVQVLDLEIRSTDTIKRKEFKTQHGNTVYAEVDEEPEKIEKRKATGNYNYMDIEVQNIYRVKWVLGTDIIFDSGKGQNIKRDPNNPAKACFSYHIVAPDIRDMVPYSRQNAIIPMVDDIQATNYKRRNTIRQIIPSGVDIDIEGLEDIDLAGDGVALSKQGLIDLLLRSGVGLYRSRAINGQYKGGNSGPPITPRAAMVGNEIEAYEKQILFNADLINKTLGFNEATDGSTVNEKNLNSTNAAMLDSTNNAISDIYFADKQMTEAIAGAVLLRAQDLMRPDEDGETREEDLANIVGWDTTKRLGDAPKLDAHSFGITIEDAPTPAEREAFQRKLDLAQGANQISVAEAILAENIAEDNILQAQIYLAYSVTKNQRIERATASQQQQDNTQAQIQSARAAELAKQETYTKQTDDDIRKMREEYAMKQEFIEAERNATILEKERIAATGRVEASFTQATERDNSNMRDNTGKLIKEGHADKIGIVNIPADLQSRVEPLTSEQHPALPKAAFSFMAQPSMPQPQTPDMQPQEQMQQQPIAA